MGCGLVNTHCSEGHYKVFEPEDSPACKSYEGGTKEDIVRAIRGENFLSAGIATSRGRRGHNEDSFYMCCDWFVENSVHVGFFAVCDGHGGSQVSDLLVETLPSAIARKLADVGKAVNEISADDMKDVYLMLEQHLLDLNTNQKYEDVGSTCVCAAVINCGARLLIANCGDSRGLVLRCAHESPAQLIDSTIDHKPSLEGERQRIESADGIVLKGRIDGQISVSRALGNFKYKDCLKLPANKQKLIAEPDIYEFDAVHGSTVVLACDGIFGSLSNERVSDHLRLNCSDPSVTADAIVKDAFQEGSMDNLTCLVVHLGQSS